MAKLTRNGFSLDLSLPDEVCLVPEKWGGRYPKTTGPDRIKKLSEQQNHRCCYCGVHTWCQHYGEDGPWQTMATVEHIVTRKRGGTNKKGNIVMACSQCNGERDISNPYIYMMERSGRLNFKLLPLENENQSVDSFDEVC